MAKYHVSLIGSNTSPYDTWAKAANDITSVLALGLTGSNTCLVDWGTYNGFGPNYILLNNSKYSNLSILGSKFGETGGLGSSRDNIRFIAAENNSCMRVATQAENVIAKHFTVVAEKDSAYFAFYSSATVGMTLENMVFEGRPYIHGSNNFDIRRCISTEEGQHPGIQFNNTGNGKCYYFVSMGGGLKNGTGIHVSGTATGVLDIINPTIVNAESNGIQHIATGVVNVYNPIVFGVIGNFYCINNLGPGTLNVYNPALIKAGNQDGDYQKDCDIYQDPVENANIKLNTYSRYGYIIPCVDDAGRFSYAQDLSAVLDTYGYKGTFFTHAGQWDDIYTGNNAALRQMVTDGIMEVGNHSWSHANPSAAVALAITYSGSDSNPTVALIAGTPRTIQLRTTEGNDDADINLSTYPTFGDIDTAIDALSNWGSALQSAVEELTKESSMSTVGATAVPYTLLLDRTDIFQGFFKDEIADSKTYWEDLLGDLADPQTGELYETNSYATPEVSKDTDYATAVKEGGHDSSRTSTYEALAELNHYQMNTTDITLLVVEGDEEATKRNTRALCQDIAVKGGVVYILAHSSVSATMEEWGWVLDTISEFNDYITTTSAQLAVFDILDNADSYDSDTGISITSFTPQTDFSILSGSECINTGLNTPLIGVPNIKDIVGSDITNGAGEIVASGDIVDIGAFEYQQLMPSDIEIIKEDKNGITFSIVPSKNMKPEEEEV